MGCYMSKPNDQVYVTEGKGRNFSFATASCQGWRREQEDAEACIPDFDDDASLFILCDGHGGAEVAKYTVLKFPDFLKKHPLYQEGRYEEALKQAFIEFDATLRTDEVMSEIIKLAFDGDDDKTDKKHNEATAKESTDCQEAKPSGSSSNADASGSSSGPSAASSSSAGPSTSNGATSIADDVDTDTLRREAQIPIEELIDKYADQETKGRILSLKRASLEGSPAIRSKDQADGQSGSGSSTAVAADGSGDQPEPSSSKQHDEKSSKILHVISDALTSNLDQLLDDSDSDDCSDFVGSSDDDSEEEEEDDSDEDGDDECDEDTGGERSKNKRLLNKKQRRSLGNHNESSTSEDSDESEESNDSEDSDESEDNSDDYEDIEDDQDDGGIISSKYLQRRFKQNFKNTRIHRPVMDSGCTVVVALTKGNKLYVASAGDSRCIAVLRHKDDTRYMALSNDHKPEDHQELRRIQNAGGQVIDGRVNGGLNLSRAFGDFTYKNADLKAKDQMITPCPDVTILDLDLEKVEYIFLACDGIWNSMSNEEAAAFIRKSIPNVNNDLVGVCMAFFSHCIAPSTDGDGTGCDNMTCILVKYYNSNEIESFKTKQNDLNKAREVESCGPQGKFKRKAMDEPGDNDQGNKRRCYRLLDQDETSTDRLAGRKLKSGSTD